MSAATSEWHDFPVASSCSLKVWTCQGARPGPTVLLTGGVHGDEYEGPAAILRITESLKAGDLSGAVIAIPVVNPLAFTAGTRTTPEDGLNLARAFPGNPNGSVTERLAAAVFSEYASQANYLIDLHSGGVEYLFLPLAGFYGEPVGDNPSYCAALRFGLPALWQLPPTEGVLSNEANKRGIVAIGHEYLGAGQLALEGVSKYAEGVFRCLRYWNLLDDGKPLREPGGDVFHGDWQLAPCDGLFFAKRKLGEHIHRGELIAEIRAISGPLAPITAESEGTLLGLRSKAYIREGNWAVLIGRKQAGTYE